MTTEVSRVKKWDGEVWVEHVTLVLDLQAARDVLAALRDEGSVGYRRRHSTVQDSVVTLLEEACWPEGA